MARAGLAWLAAAAAVAVDPSLLYKRAGDPLDCVLVALDSASFSVFVTVVWPVSECLSASLVGSHSCSCGRCKVHRPSGQTLGGRVNWSGFWSAQTTSCC